MGIAVRNFSEACQMAIPVFVWEVKCVEQYDFIYTSRINSVLRFSALLIELVLYFCSYREIKQELILKQSNNAYKPELIRNS